MPAEEAEVFYTPVDLYEIALSPPDLTVTLTRSPGNVEKRFWRRLTAESLQD